MFKVLSSWFRFSLCILGYFCATTNPALAEARLALEKETAPRLLAQVTSDDTVNTQVTENGNTAEITGGETRGDNLFHSFQDFSVKTGNEAFFNNADSISNIFSRVTGGNVSDIDGGIRANGSANLFLINPAGILFGENASLNIGGSFYGSSASSILFEDGEFSATDLTNPPLLTINAPIGLGFRDEPGDITVRGDGQGTRSTTDLIDTENALRVDSDKTFALVGGKLNLEGATIKTAGGRIELGSLQGNEQVRLTPIKKDFSLGYGEVQNFQDIQLSKTATIDASGLVAGDVRVQGKNISLTEDSQIEASTVGDSPSQYPPGTIEINAIDTIKIDGEDSSNSFSSAIVSQVYSDAVGNAGDIHINASSLDLTSGGLIDARIFGEGDGGNIDINTTANLSLTDFGQIDARVFGEGDGGNIDINDTGSVTIKNTSFIYSLVKRGAVGNAGDLNITTTNLTLTDFGQIDASTFGEGDAGSVNINATESVTLDGTTAGDNLRNVIYSSVGSGAVGNAGNLNITTDNLTVIQSSIKNEVEMGAVGNAGEININTANLDLTNGGVINAGTFGEGNGGSIDINATESVTLDGSITIIDTTFRSTIGSRVEMGAVGNAGEININTANLDLTNGSVISASTLAQGDGGRIDINATKSVTLDGNITAIFNLVGTDAVGTGGEINITTANLNLTNGGEIVATTRGQGDAGKIDINATESVTFDGTTPDGQSSGIGGVVEMGAIGNAGEINIITPNLSLTNGGRIASSTYGEGDAGRIEINATESITLDGKNPNNNLPSAIENKVESGAVGNGGGINITTPNLVLTNSGQISVSSLGVGDGGSISVNADNLTLNNGEIFAVNTPTESTANNQTPQVGGNINLEVADSINLRNNSIISAKATSSANGGNLNIDTNFIVAFPKGNNDILASAEKGNGGNITIDAESVFGIEERPLNRFTNDINASSDVLGFDGTVNIDTSDVNPVQGATELPSNIVEARQTADQTCSADRDGKATNGLAIAGRGGIHPAPDTPLNSESISNENPAQASIPQPLETSQGKIQPARGIKVSESGKISLTAYRTNNAGERIPEIKPNCN